MGSGYEIARAILTCVRAGRREADCWNSTPRQLSAWVELIGRDDLSRDDTELGLMRAAYHADKKGYREFSKKMRDQGQ